MATKQTPKTSMQIKEVIEQESGDLVINIKARRGNAHYRFVYQIARVKIPDVDLEFLKLRVREDIDRAEDEASRKQKILDRLNLQIGGTINLD